MQAKFAMSAQEVEAQFTALLDRVHDRGETVIVERDGNPVAAVIPIQLYERLIAEREARFAVVDRLQEKGAAFPEEEVLNDIAKAIAAVRSTRR